MAGKQRYKKESKSAFKRRKMKKGSSRKKANKKAKKDYG
jgi:hypothetical protein